jgi:predicted transcriptional regulator
MATTMKIDEHTKSDLDKFREYKNESYDEIVRKLIYIAKNADKSPKLSKQAVKDIEAARKRMAKGEFYTHEEMKRILGV